MVYKIWFDVSRLILIPITAQTEIGSVGDSDMPHGMGSVGEDADPLVVSPFRDALQMICRY